MKHLEAAEITFESQRGAADIIHGFPWEVVSGETFDSRLIDSVICTTIVLSPGQTTDFYINGENIHIFAHPNDELFLIGKKVYPQIIHPLHPIRIEFQGIAHTNYPLEFTDKTKRLTCFRQIQAQQISTQKWSNEDSLNAIRAYFHNITMQGGII